MTNAISNRVDLILYQQGRFIPVNWLLQEGLLDYTDYQKWLAGDVQYLQHCFAAPLQDIITDLHRVAEHAQRLGLQAEQIDYSLANGKKLYCCRKGDNEKLLTTTYKPASDRVQRDLFFDCSAACTANELISALLAGKQRQMQILLGRLHRLDAEKCRQFRNLLTVREELLKGFSDHRGGDIALLEQELTPLAYELLGECSDAFLVPLWQNLSARYAGRPFDPAAAQSHLSYTALQGLQWREVITAVEGGKDWQKQPLLLFRHAEACCKLRREAEGLTGWFRLLLFYPETAARLINDTGNRLLHGDWRKFRELEPELKVEFFPAWTLLNKPALTKITAGFTAADTDGCAALQLMAELLSAPQGQVSEAKVKLRAGLRQLDTALFAHYMAAASQVQ